MQQTNTCSVSVEILLLEAYLYVTEMRVRWTLILRTEHHV